MKNIKNPIYDRINILKFAAIFIFLGMFSPKRATEMIYEGVKKVLDTKTKR